MLSPRTYALVFEALADLPDNTVIDGEIVALNESGRPDFNLLQHHRTDSDHLRHSKFAGIREDKDSRSVKEHAGEA